VNMKATVDERLRTMDGFRSIGFMTDGQPVNMKATVDERQRTMDGFRSIGLIAIFLAALQAQMLSVSLPDNGTLSAKFVNALWLAGVFLDVYAAVLATLTARWFEVLQPLDVEFLNDTWVTKARPTPSDRSRKHLKGFIEYCVATSLFSSLGVLSVGVVMFFVGLLIFVWAKQPLLVSIIATIPFAVLTPLTGCLFIPHERGRANIIELLAQKKGHW